MIVIFLQTLTSLATLLHCCSTVVSVCDFRNILACCGISDLKILLLNCYLTVYRLLAK